MLGGLTRRACPVLRQLRRQLQPGDLETDLRWWPSCGKLSPEPGDAAAAGHAQEYCSLAALNSYILHVDGGALLQALEVAIVAARVQTQI